MVAPVGQDAHGHAGGVPQRQRLHGPAIVKCAEAHGLSRRHPNTAPLSDYSDKLGRKPGVGKPGRRRQGAAPAAAGPDQVRVLVAMSSQTASSRITPLTIICQ